MQQNKTALNFRDTNLFNILKLAVDMLSKSLITDDATMGSPDLRYQLYDASLQLFSRCCAFDSKVSAGEELWEIHPALNLPEKWMRDVLQNKTFELLFNVYNQCVDPLTTTALDALLWLLYAPRSDLYAAETSENIFGTIMKGLTGILNSKHGLDNPDTIHSFVQIVDRFKVGIGRWRRRVDGDESANLA